MSVCLCLVEVIQGDLWRSNGSHKDRTIDTQLSVATQCVSQQKFSSHKQTHYPTNHHRDPGKRTRKNALILLHLHKAQRLRSAQYSKARCVSQLTNIVLAQILVTQFAVLFQLLRTVLRSIVLCPACGRALCMQMRSRIFSSSVFYNHFIVGAACAEGGCTSYQEPDRKMAIAQKGKGKMYRHAAVGKR